MDQQGTPIVDTSWRAHFRDIRLRGNRFDVLTAIRAGLMPPPDGPNMISCRDGFRFSVIAGWGARSTPRPDMMLNRIPYDGPYWEVEVGFHDNRGPKPARLWAPYRDTTARLAGGAIVGSTSVYNYVPIGLVYALIRRHGGEAPPGTIGRPYRYTRDHMKRRARNVTRNAHHMAVMASSLLDELGPPPWASAGMDGA